MSDGTMYFGTFNGGLAQYKNGRWKSFLAAPGGLANNSVWCLAEDPYHRLIIGTLGSGFQIYNPESGKFTTYNVQKIQVLPVILSTRSSCRIKMKF